MWRKSSVSKTRVAMAPDLACCGVNLTTTSVGAPERRFMVPWFGATCEGACSVRALRRPARCGRLGG
eukprot:scaffold315921_cov31-Tisochrysis_lutea.AAC.2